MKFIVSWIFNLFSKPKEEITFDKAVVTAWPFPVEEELKPKRKYVRKATTRPAKKAKVVTKTAVAKKTSKKKAK
jgi:hypothetical protein